MTYASQRPLSSNENSATLPMLNTTSVPSFQGTKSLSWRTDEFIGLSQKRSPGTSARSTSARVQALSAAMS